PRRGLGPDPRQLAWLLRQPGDRPRGLGVHEPLPFVCHRGPWDRIPILSGKPTGSESCPTTPHAPGSGTPGGRPRSVAIFRVSSAARWRTRSTAWLTAPRTISSSTSRSPLNASSLIVQATTSYLPLTRTLTIPAPASPS